MATLKLNEDSMTGKYMKIMQEAKDIPIPEETQTGHGSDSTFENDTRPSVAGKNTDAIDPIH